MNKQVSQSLNKAKDKQIHATHLEFPCLTICINKLISVHIWHCNVHHAASLLSHLKCDNLKSIAMLNPSEEDPKIHKKCHEEPERLA